MLAPVFFYVKNSFLTDLRISHIMKIEVCESRKRRLVEHYSLHMIQKKELIKAIKERYFFWSLV